MLLSSVINRRGRPGAQRLAQWHLRRVELAASAAPLNLGFYLLTLTPGCLVLLFFLVQPACFLQIYLLIWLASFSHDWALTSSGSPPLSVMWLDRTSVHWFSFLRRVIRLWPCMPPCLLCPIGQWPYWSTGLCCGVFVPWEYWSQAEQQSMERLWEV